MTTYRLQELPHLLQREGEDIVGFTMSVDGKVYKMINDAALKAAAACLLLLPDRLSDVEFDRDRFLELALSSTEAEGNG